MTTAPLVRTPRRQDSAGSAPSGASLAGAAGSPGLLGPYLGYIGYFVGAGLISGSVVHYPLDPARYAVIGIAGALVFLLATVLNEFILPRRRPAGGQLLRIVGGSLLLSMGIGMLSGGIQHFNEFPARSAVLVPAGLVVSFIAYIVRNAPHRWKATLGPIGLGVVTTAVLAFAGLNYLAAHSTAAEHGHGAEHGEAAATGGGHAEQPATSDHPADEGQAVATPATVKVAGTGRPRTTLKATPTEGSHEDHPHGTDEDHR